MSLRPTNERTNGLDETAADDPSLLSPGSPDCRASAELRAETSGPRPRPAWYAVDQAGAAKSCTVPKVTPAEGKDTPVPMTVGNDGGWCAISVTQPASPNESGPNPYKAGLLDEPPRARQGLCPHRGRRDPIDYRPAPGYAGPDSFAVTLVPGNAVLRADVTVTK